MTHYLKNLIVLSSLALAQAAYAQAVTQDDVLTASVLVGWQMDNGHRMAALRLDLAPDWKTYWRAPGESGIPPQFDWTGSSNIAAVRLHWPKPVVFHLNDMQSIGYHSTLVLPLELVLKDPSKPARLVGTADLGICKDICMPAHVVLDADLSGAGASDPAIEAALAALPIQAKAAGVQDVSCDVSPIADGIALTARIQMPPLNGTEVVVFEPADPLIWVATAQAQWEGRVLVARTEMVAPSGAAFALDRSALRITVIDTDQSVEILGCPAP
jgi:DsbC/DsbD-like thiol-disulfide interchange protein